MLERKTSFHAVYRDFQWDVPSRFNIGVDICDKWAEADPDRLAIIDIDTNGGRKDYRFIDLYRRSNQLANALTKFGINGTNNEIGDRVGILLPQCVQTALSHIAVTKMGCVSIPLFTLFGEEALLHRLKDSNAKAIITNAEGLAKITAIKEQLPDLKLILSIDGEAPGAICFKKACAAQPESFKPTITKADDPAILIYTSGTTGNPKGALHPHRVLLGHLPGVEISHNFIPEKQALFWTPADWAWIGGLLDILMPALHHGVCVLACRFEKFSAEAAFELIKTYKITNAFLPPTALKIMKLHPDMAQYGIKMHGVASGGESLGAELIEWGQNTLGTTINEFYGQTECNMIVSSCSALETPPPGAMGRAVPGHEVAIIDPDSGEILPDGTEGAIAVLSPDPVMFLGYWNNPEATMEKFVEGPEGKWLLTGDRGRRDAEGWFYFLGRNDDVIGSAGYRIGPSEVENCLIRHEAVHLAGVVGKPDKLRGSVVAAYLTLKPSFTPSKDLADDIANYVKTRLAAHEYPRVVRFITDMPMTTTGKIIRAKLRLMAEQEAAQEELSQ